MQLSTIVLFAVAALGAVAAPVELEARGGSRITWYSGHNLDNPACGGARPNDGSMIGAVKKGGRFRCNQRITIQHKGKQVRVKVVDFCEGCGSGDVDLTKGAFKKLAPLSKGVLQANAW